MQKVLAVAVAVTVLALAWTGWAQSVDAQGNASAGAQAGVGQSSAQAESNASVGASAQAKQEGRAKDKKPARAEASGSAHDSAAVNAGGSELNLDSEARVHAVLKSTLDSRKAKEGDPVVAKVTQDVKTEAGTVIAKKSKLIGRVTRAQARARGDAQSELGLVFEKAVLRDGREVPVHLVVQALAAARSEAAAGHEPMPVPAPGAPSAGGGLLSTAGAAVSGTTGLAGGVAGGVSSTASGTADAAAGGLGSTAAAATTLNSASTGVIGLKDLRLESALDSSTQGSVISSGGQSVKLASGTQMMLRVAKQ